MLYFCSDTGFEVFRSDGVLVYSRVFLEKIINTFLAIEGKRIKSWKGYQTIGKGYHICERTLPLNFKNLEQRIFEELNRLRQLADGVEQALNEVNGEPEW